MTKSRETGFRTFSASVRELFSALHAPHQGWDSRKKMGFLFLERSSFYGKGERGRRRA